MATLALTSENRALWDAFVSRHPHATIGHHAETIAWEAEHLGVSSRAFLFVDDDRRVLAVCPLVETTGAEARAFATRSLVSGTQFPSGPLLDASLSVRAAQRVLGDVVGEVTRIAREVRADRVRLAYPVTVGDRLGIEYYGYCPLRAFGFSDANGIALVLDVRGDEQLLYKTIDSSCRNKARRAQREGVRIAPIETVDAWHAVHPLAKQTLGDMALSEAAMHGVWARFIEPGRAAAFGAYVEDRMVSAVVMTSYGRSSYYWMGFNEHPRRVTGANNLVLWEAIKARRADGACFVELGSKEFDGGRQQAISDFKESFGARACYGLAGVRDFRPWRRLGLDVVRLAVSSARARRQPSPGSGTPPNDGTAPETLTSVERPTE